MAKTEFLQIRLSPQDRERIRRAAAAEHLDASTWARRVILRELESSEIASGAAPGGTLAGAAGTTRGAGAVRDA